MWFCGGVSGVFVAMMSQVLLTFFLPEKARSVMD